MTATTVEAFRAMGTEIRVLADPDADPAIVAGAVREAARSFAREERRFSRFRADSELSRVNASGGGSVRVSAAFAEVLNLALAAARESDGLFDPTVLPALVAAGYDRDFDDVLAGARDALHPPTHCGRWREVEVRGRAIRLPAGTGLDLGGIAKGWTADLAAQRCLDAGMTWVAVNAGGDIRIAGDAPPMMVGVEDPDDRSSNVTLLRLSEGGLATSSTTARAWGPGRHHLIDPRSGLPASTGVVQATAWAATCAEAEVRAKVAVLEGRRALDRFPGVLVLEDGSITMNLEEVAA